MFRISRSGSDEITDVAQVDEIERAIRANPPGRYDIFKIELKPRSSGHTRRPWGIAFRRQGGSVLIKPDSGDESDADIPGSAVD